MTRSQHATLKRRNYQLVPAVVDNPAPFRHHPVNLGGKTRTNVPFFAELQRRNVFRVGAAYAVVAWILIEVSDTVFPRLGLPEWTVTFVIALLLLGFPVALFFSWAYELTPAGLRRENDVDPGESITPRTGKRLDRAIIVMVALSGLRVGPAFQVVFQFLSLTPAREHRRLPHSLRPGCPAASMPSLWGMPRCEAARQLTWLCRLDARSPQASLRRRPR